MSASVTAIKPASTKARLASLRQEVRALLDETWNDALKGADAFEKVLRELDQEGIPEGVRQEARLLIDLIASKVMTMGQIMERRS